MITRRSGCVNYALRSEEAKKKTTAGCKELKLHDSDAPALHAMPDADLNDTALVSSHFTDFCAEADATQVTGRTHHEQTRTRGASQGWRQLPLEAFVVASATTVSELPVGTETTGEIVPIMPCAASSLFGEHTSWSPPS